MNMLRMIGNMNLVYEGGQKDDFTEALQKLYRNRQKKVVSWVNGCLTRYDWRKRSMSTHSERFNPPTFEPENGLKTA